MIPGLAEAVAALAAGGVIAYPTETLYGLGCDPGQEGALARLEQLKGRPGDKGVILLVRDRAALESWLLPLSPLAERLIAACWPGPLTLVLPARSGLSARLTGGRDTLAVRCSPAPVVRQLLALWPQPLVSTSANLHGQPPVTCADQARALWGDALAWAVEGVVADHGLPSTVVAVREEEAWLLRPGALSVEALVRLKVPLRVPGGTLLR